MIEGHCDEAATVQLEPSQTQTSGPLGSGSLTLKPIDDTEEDAGDDNEGEGQGRTSACAVDEQQQRSVARLRYPEVRGLRFCPEDRKHRDRDVEAALTIGRLHCMTLLGLGRPAPFCRGVTLQL